MKKAGKCGENNAKMGKVGENGEEMGEIGAKCGGNEAQKGETWQKSGK